MRSFAKITQYGGLWLMEEPIGAKLIEMGTDSEKHVTLSLSYNLGEKSVQCV